MRPWPMSTCEADRIVLHFYTILNEKWIAPITYSLIYTHNVWCFSFNIISVTSCRPHGKEGQTCSFFTNAFGIHAKCFFSLLFLTFYYNHYYCYYEKKNDEKALLLLCADPPVLSMLYYVYTLTPTRTHLYTHTFKAFN